MTYRSPPERGAPTRCLVTIGLAVLIIACSPPAGTQPTTSFDAGATAPAASPTVSQSQSSATDTPPATLAATPPPATAIATADLVLPFPLCELLPELVAPAEWYRDVTAHPGTNPEVADIKAWAQRQPGFEELWIDREEHDGWVSLAFSKGAEAAQGDLVAKFPDRAAVVVPVDWTLSELKSLQQKVGPALVAAGAQNSGSGMQPQNGVVTVGLAYLEPDLLAALEDMFAGERLCVSGMDPALKPPEGPQPQSGEGWRLVADQDLTGEAFRTGIAYDDVSYGALWKEAGLAGSMPEVDFTSEVVIWFGAAHGSSCPRLRLDDVVVEPTRPLVHGTITVLDAGVCTADALPHAYLVALDRRQLPPGPFAIQLGAEDPPEGVPEERTVVDADLSAPGSTTDPGHVHQGGQIPH